MNQLYKFEWSDNKAQSNARKHGVTFEQATAVFRDPRALTIYDEAHSDDEDRWITMGFVDGLNELVVVHTYVENIASSVTIRIISARRADKQEKRQYQTNLDF